MTNPTYPAIMLPGPAMAAYTVTISSYTSTPAGEDISISKTIQGDGTGMVQVLDYLQANFSEWYPYFGGDIAIDFGKGPIHRSLDDRWGVYEWAE